MKYIVLIKSKDEWDWFAKRYWVSGYISYKMAINEFNDRKLAMTVDGNVALWGTIKYINKVKQYNDNKVVCFKEWCRLEGVQPYSLIRRLLRVVRHCIS